ncbi:Cell morphogenesis protein PAG1, partial [Kickxella alabastrina]
MSSEQLGTTIDPTLLQSLAQQHLNTSSQLSGFSQLQINPDPSSLRNNYGYSFGSPVIHTSAAMNDNPGTAPININRNSGFGNSNQQGFGGSAASFDYERGNIANSFQQLQQQQFGQQQQHQQQNFFRTHLGSPSQQTELFSPVQDELHDVSPLGSFQQNTLVASMASAAMPTNIPMLGSQHVNANHMLRMHAFSTSPAPQSPAFQSMSLPANHKWFDSHLVQQQSINSALDPSSFNAQQFSGSNADGMSPQNQALMSLMENDDGDTSQKSAIVSYEKRRRRRESHNAVERRRRDNINDRIQELSNMLPEAMIDANTKPNKGIILKKS